MAGLKFKVNNKVEIISEEGVFACDIQDIQDKHLAISIPIKDFQYLPLRKDERIQVLYYEGNNIYKFASSVIKRDKSNIPLLWIKIPDRFEKIQRRKFVRVSVLYEARCALIDRDLELNKENLSNIRFHKGTILDLSGGGARLKTELSAKKDDVFILVLPVEESFLIVKGEVKRAALDELGERIYGLNFINLKMMEQEKIIRSVFQIMREQMKKGLREE
ncbi:flagellar protein [Clostridium bovifaecis]|uniref:Flagellar protein n=1 Tax=Clostridium bovifaecis TaxID=2184719 RepID=A0A6I6EN38_9CLOT|nr:flagellar protein [Clostridium bovifaecis]